VCRQRARLFRRAQRRPFAVARRMLKSPLPPSRRPPRPHRAPQSRPLPKMVRPPCPRRRGMPRRPREQSPRRRPAPWKPSIPRRPISIRWEPVVRATRLTFLEERRHRPTPSSRRKTSRRKIRPKLRQIHRSSLPMFSRAPTIRRTTGSRSTVVWRRPSPPWVPPFRRTAPRAIQTVRSPIQTQLRRR
jgi:hypothetical protein